MNPAIPHVYAADPAARVWEGDRRLWVYASHDEPFTNTHDTMRSYHAFSTYDLKHWVDHGVILHLGSVAWASSHMWAIDCIARHGKYYLVYCATELASGMFRTGLAISDLPEGPFEDIGFVKGVDHGQDPAVFVDENDTPYLYWGSGFNMHVCQLRDDLKEAVPGTYRKLSDELTWAFEGPWVHQYKGLYYLTYPGLRDKKWPEEMFYATAEHPLGPFTFRGCYIPKFDGQAGTNHGSVVQWNGSWYAFHHSMWLSNESTRRSVMIDRLEYGSQGEILPIVPTPNGLDASKNQVSLLLQAENGEASMGSLVGVTVNDRIPGFFGRGYVENFKKNYFGFTVVAQVSHPTKAILTIRYCAPEQDEYLAVMVNQEKMPGDEVDESHDSWTSRYRFSKSEGWDEKVIGTVDLLPGDNIIRVYKGPKCSSGIKVDSVRLDIVEMNFRYRHSAE